MAYADEEHPISLSFTPAETNPEHVHVTVRSGINGARAHCGDLVLRHEDWTVLRQLLELGAEQWRGDLPRGDEAGAMTFRGPGDAVQRVSDRHPDGLIWALRDAVVFG